MTVQQSTFFKNNWISLSTLIALIGFTIQQAKWQESVDNRIATLEISVIKHHTDKNEHMPFKDKIQIFVPRIELDARLESMEKTLIRIEENQNK